MIALKGVVDEPQQIAPEVCGDARVTRVAQPPALSLMELTAIAPDRQRDGNLWRATVAAATDLLQIFSFTDFFHRTAATLAKLLDADGAALVVREGPDQLRYRLFYGLELLNQESISKFRFSSSRGTVGRVLRSGKCLFTEDYPNSADAMPEFVAVGLQSNLVCPLPGPQGYAGAIAISWLHHRPAKLAAETLDIVEMFAALVGASLYREALEHQLETSSLTDPLTGLPNRRMLLLRVAEAQKRACRNQTLMVLALLDLDGFKEINDRFGHAAGDRMLITAAAAIQHATRGIDMVGRLGGDEFVVILEDLRSLPEVKGILSRIVHAMHTEHAGDPAGLRLSASIGATVYPADFTEPEQLLLHADQAMYQSKRNGGNQFSIRNELS